MLDIIPEYAHTTSMLDRTMATAKSPKMGFRFRSKAEYSKIKRAARSQGMSMNTFVVSHAALAAEKILASMASPVAAQPTDGAQQASYS